MKLIILLTFLVITTHSLFSQTFIEQTSIKLSEIDYSSVAWGDYDNDGNLDILITGYNGTSFVSKIYKNNGNNSFTEQTGIKLTNVMSGSVAWGDYDNDGDLDIMLTGEKTGVGNPITEIYKNNGNNSFTKLAVNALENVAYGSVAWGDYDNDGDLDILLTGKTSSSYISKVYKNNGNETFTALTGVYLEAVRWGSVAWGDYDNDGDLDILLTGNNGFSDIAKIYKNNGNSTFNEQTGISLTGVDFSSVAWGDYDNDGDLDILLTGQSKSSYISKIYKNNGNNTFTEQTNISIPGVAHSSVAWGDYDNDGNLDILISGSNKTTKFSKIYKNNGNNTFTEQTDISLKGVNDSSVAWGDYDNDGDLDILLTGSINCKIYNNEGTIVNAIPSTPSNLKQMVNGNSVTFYWDKATDKETPQNGLSYNLFIQSNDGKIIKSPLSDISNGKRKVVSIGNVEQNNFWTIKGLNEGMYSWCVQSIDHNYAGSKFAPLNTFNVEKAVAPMKPNTPVGADSLCLNPSNSEYITVIDPTATTYRWSITPSTAGVITGESITSVVYWSNTFYGSAKIGVVAVNSAGESESSDSLTVIITAPPSSIGIISGDQTVCQETSDHLYKVATIDGATSYIWSLPEGAIGTSTSDSINISFDDSAVSGNIIVKGQNSCGVGSENSLEVTVNTKPQKPVVTKNDNILESSATIGNQWYKNNQLIPEATGQQYFSTGDGVYYVVVSLDGCNSEPSDIYMVTGNEMVHMAGFDIYPNPVSQELFIVADDSRFVVKYIITDLSGKTILDGSFLGKTMINATGIIPGVYLLKIEKEEESKTLKFVKE